MRIYIRLFKDMPKCKHCGRRMDYWIPGLSDEEHAHPECAGRAMAKQVMDDCFTHVHITYDEDGRPVVK